MPLAPLSRAASPALRLRQLSGNERLGLGNAVDVDDSLRPHGGNGLAGDDDPHEVQRIGRVDHHTLPRPGLLAQPGELIQSRGKRVLLAAEAADEPTAADEPAVLEPA